MGIKESLEQTPDEQDIKLKDLTLETEKEEEVFFDPEKEISEQDWEEIKSAILEASGKQNNLYNLANLALLFPTRIEELDIEKKLKQLEKVTTGIYGLFRGEELLHRISLFKIIKPKLTNFLESERINLGFNGIKEELIEKYASGYLNQDTFLTGIANLKIVFPERKDELILEQLWPKVKKDYKENEPSVSKDPDYLFYMATQIADLRIAFPQGKEITKNAVEKNLQNIIKIIKEDIKKKEWIKFINFAALYKIITAEKVEVTDHGLELTMPKKEFKAQKHQRPERKKY